MILMAIVIKITGLMAINWSIPYFGTNPYRKMKDLPTFPLWVWNWTSDTIGTSPNFFALFILDSWSVLSVDQTHIVHAHCRLIQFGSVTRCMFPPEIGQQLWLILPLIGFGGCFWFQHVSTISDMNWLFHLHLGLSKLIRSRDHAPTEAPAESAEDRRRRVGHLWRLAVDIPRYFFQATNGLQQRSCHEGDTRTAIGIAQPITQFWLDSNVCFFLSLYGKMMQTMFRSLKPPFRRGMLGNASILTHSSR